MATACQLPCHAARCAHPVPPAPTVRLATTLSPTHLPDLPCSVASNGATCSAAALSHPAAQKQTHQLFQLLELANFSLLPVATNVQPAAECTTVLTFFQLTAGLVLPLLVHAVVESSLFGEHQRQRQQQGMPLVSGFMQSLYGFVGGLSEALDGVTLAASLWMLMGLLWKLSVALSSGQGRRT